MSNILPSLFQQIVHLSRYSRWDYSKNRRETWEETVKRYFDFFENHLRIKYNFELTKEMRLELETAVLTLETMPSMRAMMTAGPALEKDNVAGFNCSFLPIDNPRAFDEILYLLCCGCGVGFSVERQYITKLPSVPEELYETDTVIIVSDSKIGWAKALKELIALLYTGQIPKWDLTKIRPAGSILKTFGGRSAGSEPLNRLFKFCVQKFKESTGRKLQSIEVHDIICMIAEIVISGGKRRSATISLSNVSDDRMRNAKSGQWYEIHPYRSLANNSACYTETPDMAIFMKEWFSLYDSKSGERGIFNLEGSRKHAAKQRKGTEYRKRKAELIQGVNPCLTGDTIISTSNGPVKVIDLEGKEFSVIFDGKEYKSTENGFFFTGEKEVFQIETKRGYSIKATSNHKFNINGEWKELKDIESGDNIKLGGRNFHKEWSGFGNFELGWLLGNIKGDGYISSNTCALSWWGNNKEEMKNISKTCIEKSSISYRNDICSGKNLSRKDKITVKCYGALKEIQDKEYGISPDVTKSLSEYIILNTSSEFQKGFIRGWFDADGSVQGNREKGLSIRLSSIDLNGLYIIQKMLTSFGIYCTIYKNRKDEGYKSLPDGHGGYKEYYCEPFHELCISKDNMILYKNIIGFYDINKSIRLEESLVGYKPNQYYDKLDDKVVDVKYIGKEKVYDCQIPEKHCFVANGILTHNCGEAFLKQNFCNLSEAVVRDTDTRDDIRKKVQNAAILGTFQSTLTDFRYLRKEWKTNTEDEMLLGVSLTGIMDNKFTSTPSKELEEFLDELKKLVIETNIEFANKLGIKESVACTVIKPSGTVSSLVNSSSGIHARHSKYYIRTIRMDSKDPLCSFMKDMNIPYELDCMNGSNIVFSFPVKSPDNSIFRNDLTAIQQLEIYLLYKKHYTEHNVSITISVKEHEWLEVGAFVYKHFDDISGVSFLPYSDHCYRQAPFQECSEKEYNDLLRKIPKDIDWDKLGKYEKEDYTSGSKEYACTGGVCELI